MRDFDIRVALKNSHLKRYYHDSSIIVEELDISCTGARIDIAVINGSLHGFEIKSAQDTLVRLPYQIDSYTKVFDFVSVVTEEKHLNKVINILPEWVGVYSADNQGKVEGTRYPSINTNTESFFLAKLLWREELLDTLTDLKIKHLKKERNWLLCETLANHLQKEEISRIVRTKLKQRENWKLKSKAGLRFWQNDDCDQF